MEKYIQGYGKILIDSGAFSTLNSGRQIDVVEYCQWVKQFEPMIDAYAGLDSIEGDWRQSLKNYEHGGFPTIHDSDPLELLDELIPIAEERGNWLGIGLQPPRQGKANFIRRVLDNVPDHLHVHGWALTAYRYLTRIDSFDSTTWIREIMKLRPAFPFLTPGELMEITIKKHARFTRIVGNFDLPPEPEQLDFFIDGNRSKTEEATWNS